MGESLTQEVDLYLSLGLTPIPLKYRSKQPLVRWGEEWNPTSQDLLRWAANRRINWAVRGGPELAILDFDQEHSFHAFVATHQLPSGCPVIRTARGHHIWVRPKKPVRSQRVPALGLEVKCMGGYGVAPRSVHPSGVTYEFEVAPNGAIPEVDLEELLGLHQQDKRAAKGDYESIRQNAPSDFALRYGKSALARPLFGKATKVLTSPDGSVKRLISLRCWSWDCVNCAPFLKITWRTRLKGLPFRFILRLPSPSKPTKFLGRLKKPPYVHIVANDESWLFLLGGERQTVWGACRQAGYSLVAGDVRGDPAPDEVAECLEEALCREEQPLNKRRKVSHSRGLISMMGAGRNGATDTEDCPGSTDETRDSIQGKPGGRERQWVGEVVMKSIKEVVEDLERRGWRVIWQSEVEALAMRRDAEHFPKVDIVELLNLLGIELKRVGKEWMGLCSFHHDNDPSLSVNREKGVWYCHGCQRGGTARDFLDQYRVQGGAGGGD